MARTATHLFHWIAFRDALAGWGPVARRAVASWYEDKDPAQLAYQVVKYRQRDGVSHADALRLAHPRATTDAHGHIYDLACELALRQRGAEGRSERRPTEHDPDEAMLAPDGELAKVQGYLYARESESPARTARLVREYGLPREALKTEHLDSVEVWDALLEGMPITATIRNLGNMTRLGLLTPTSEATQRVLERLADEDRLRRGRVHPIQVLAAHTTYASGGGARGSGSWDPVVQVVDALDAAFYTSFGSVEPTGKRTMLAIDISGSMSYNNIAGVPGLLARTGAAAMALVTAAVEQRYEVTAFSSPTWSSAGLETVPLSPRQRLDDAIRAINSLRAGGTDCALPMLWAEEQGREVDTFVVYTDNETWAGSVHPAQALRDYRQRSGIHDAKLIVVGMVANDFTIADPADEGMLDVVGFDTSAPNLMSAFARGEL